MVDERIDQRPANTIRVHRRGAGLSQREVGWVLGYPNEGAMARHEQCRATPSLRIAIAYERIFHIPVSEIFGGLSDEVGGDIEMRLAQLEERLGQRSARERDAMTTARKLMWLAERRKASGESLP